MLPVQLMHTVNSTWMSNPKTNLPSHLLFKKNPLAFFWGGGCNTDASCDHVIAKDSLSACVVGVFFWGNEMRRRRGWLAGWTVSTFSEIRVLVARGDLRSGALCWSC